MGYAVGYDDKTDRWVGYGVPAPCDLAGCDEQIHRGFGYKCEEHLHYQWDEDIEEETEIFDPGCGFFFCSRHVMLIDNHGDVTAKPDSAEWLHYILTDPSWGPWRVVNQDKVHEYLTRRS